MPSHSVAEAILAEIHHLAASLATRSGLRTRERSNRIASDAAKWMSKLAEDAAMVLGYHCIFGMYGFWLPNDPRGSGSDYIAVWELFRYGPATKTLSRRSVAHAPHDRAARLAAKRLLEHPPVELTGKQAVAVVGGFQQACEEAGYRIHACAVLPDHVHLVICRHPRRIRQAEGISRRGQRGR